MPVPFMKLQGLCRGWIMNKDNPFLEKGFHQRSFPELRKGVMKEIKRDAFLVGGLLIVGAVIVIAAFAGGDPGQRVDVAVDGQQIASYPLAENRTVTIQGKGGANVLVIENGAAFIQDADCPDRLCVRQGKIDRSGQSVICLPHKVVVSVAGQPQEDVDIVVK